MKYEIVVKHRRGCYWWLDQKAFETARSLIITTNAESDDESIYNAALLANIETMYNVYDKRSLTPYDISNIEYNWGYYSPPCKLETLMDHPLKYLNNNTTWLAADGIYVQYIKNVDTGTVVWKDKTMDPEYNGFETPQIFIAWYGSINNLEKGILSVRQSRSFYAPNKVEAVIAAATKISNNYYRDDRIKINSEPTLFCDMLYDMNYSDMKMILNSQFSRVSDMSGHGLHVGLIQNSDNTQIWRSSYLHGGDSLVIPDRSAFE